MKKGRDRSWKRISSVSRPLNSSQTTMPKFCSRKTCNSEKTTSEYMSSSTQRKMSSPLRLKSLSWRWMLTKDNLRQKRRKCMSIGRLSRNTKGRRLIKLLKFQVISSKFVDWKKPMTTRETAGRSTGKSKSKISNSWSSSSQSIWNSYRTRIDCSLRTTKSFISVWESLRRQKSKESAFWGIKWEKLRSYRGLLIKLSNDLYLGCKLYLSTYMLS